MNKPLILLRTVALTCILKMGCLSLFAQSDADRVKIAASQAGASPLFFDPFKTKIDPFEVSSFNDARETNIRGGLPNFFSKLNSGKTVTVGFIGGSITQAYFGYRLQTTQLIQTKFPKAKFKWMNAGVSGTGTDLGACRIGEQILKHQPDLVFIEFAVNGGYEAGMEGMIRQIKSSNPQTDICLIYTVLNPQAKVYTQAGAVPENIQSLEKIAAHYNIPSIHLGIEAAILESEDKLIWKADAKTVTDKIVFSSDGIHPLPAGGNLYAGAILRGISKLSGNVIPKKYAMPPALIEDNWEDATMVDPLTAAQFSDGWEKTITKNHPKLKQFNAWFPYVMESGEPGSSFSFRFRGSMFGLFNIGGPEAGQLSVTIDGKNVKLQNVTGRGFRLYKADRDKGDSLLNLFNAFCNNRYRGQYDFVEVPEGEHMVTITISDQKADKKTILGINQQKDITENPEKYNRTVLYLGKILLRGKILPFSTDTHN